MKKLLVSAALTAALGLAAVPQAHATTSWFCDWLEFTPLDEFNWALKQIQNEIEKARQRPGVPAVGGVNPNWEDSGKGTSDPKEVVQDSMALVLQKGGRINLAPGLWATAFGHLLLAQGKGILPVYQPSDDDDNGGTTSGAPNGTALPKNFNADDLAKGKVGPQLAPSYDPDGGSFSDYVQGLIKGGPKPAMNKGKNGGKKDSTDPADKANHNSKIFGNLPGPPDKVNPAWDGGRPRAKTTIKAKVRTKVVIAQNGTESLPDRSMVRMTMRSDIRMPSFGGGAAAIGRIGR
jgi:hypothetical protein